MKPESAIFRCACLTTGLVISTMIASAQGTITFDTRPNFNGMNYYELGMWFRVVNPVQNYAMGIVGPITSPSGIPYNSTPYLGYIRQGGDDYVSFSLTNGSLFGMTSVDLADANSPSLSAVPITFIGYLAGGLTVTNTFITPGNGATTFANYTLNSAFASGLASVDIQAPRWAMDNLVFTIPEPGVGSLLAIGLIALVARKRCHATG